MPIQTNAPSLRTRFGSPTSKGLLSASLNHTLQRYMLAGGPVVVFDKEVRDEAPYLLVFLGGAYKAQEVTIPVLAKNSISFQQPPFQTKMSIADRLMLARPLLSQTRRMN